MQKKIIKHEREQLLKIGNKYDDRCKLDQINNINGLTSLIKIHLKIK